jgi:hypothetical protein
MDAVKQQTSLTGLIARHNKHLASSSPVEEGISTEPSGNAGCSASADHKLIAHEHLSSSSPDEEGISTEPSAFGSRSSLTFDVMGISCGSIELPNGGEKETRDFYRSTYT